ncbi:hypothetical protein BJX63DRAFT_386335 [Aspergillus granulosus]|uniref:Uncharacterized protein n=1 Tax=Aspergillus granulosus TaxID=176169 RepID=A0ABR4HNX5_9EURO
MLEMLLNTPLILLCSSYRRSLSLGQSTKTWTAVSWVPVPRSVGEKQVINFFLKDNAIYCLHVPFCEVGARSRSRSSSSSKSPGTINSQSVLVTRQFEQGISD